MRRRHNGWYVHVHHLTLNGVSIEPVFLVTVLMKTTTMTILILVLMTVSKSGCMGQVHRNMQPAIVRLD